MFSIPNCRNCDIFKQKINEKINKEINIYNIDYAENYDYFETINLRYIKFPSIQFFNAYSYDIETYEYNEKEINNIINKIIDIYHNK